MSQTTPTLLGLVLLSCFTSSHAYTLRPSINNLQAATTSRSTQACMSDVTVMMNGLPGAMGLEIAVACLRREGVALAPFALTGPGCAGEVDVDDGSGGGKMTVQLYERRHGGGRCVPRRRIPRPARSCASISRTRRP